MPADLHVVAFVSKIVLTAGIVVGAAMATERAGALLGALIVTLPISAGPAYFFLALDHGPEFIAASALGSLAVNAANGVFGLVYAALAQRRGLLVSLLSALWQPRCVRSNGRWWARSCSTPPSMPHACRSPRASATPPCRSIASVRLARQYFL
jgi:hypothetical protein